MFSCRFGLFDSGLCKFVFCHVIILLVNCENNMKANIIPVFLPPCIITAGDKLLNNNSAILCVLSDLMLFSTEYRTILRIKPRMTKPKLLKFILCKIYTSNFTSKCFDCLNYFISHVCGRLLYKTWFWKLPIKESLFSYILFDMINNSCDYSHPCSRVSLRVFLPRTVAGCISKISRIAVFNSYKYEIAQ